MESISAIEKELVGAYLQDFHGKERRETLIETLDCIAPADFSTETASELFGIIRAFYLERGDLPTLLEIIDLAGNNPALRSIGHHELLSEYMEAGVALSTSIVADRERIKQESERRFYTAELNRALDALRDQSNRPSTVFREISHNIETAQDKGRQSAIIQSQKAWFKLLDEIENGAADISIPTGLNALDFVLDGGYLPHTLNVIAARPGEGKTALMLQMARAAARAGFSPLIFSLEMTALDIIERHYRQTIGEDPRNTDRDKAVYFSHLLDAETLDIIDTPQTITDIESTVLRYQRNHPKAVYYIDYLSFIGRTKEQASSAAVDFLDEITRRLKNLAKRTGAAVILLVQLNRDSTKTGEPPKISQLRGSGGIEQNADTILLVWNPERDTERDTNTRRIIKIAKNRRGEAGRVIEASFDGNKTLFEVKSDTDKRTVSAYAFDGEGETESAADYSFLATGRTDKF